MNIICTETTITPLLTKSCFVQMQTSTHVLLRKVLKNCRLGFISSYMLYYINNWIKITYFFFQKKKKKEFIQIKQQGAAIWYDLGDEISWVKFFSILNRKIVVVYNHEMFIIIFFSVYFQNVLTLDGNFFFYNLMKIEKWKNAFGLDFPIFK